MKNKKMDYETFRKKVIDGELDFNTVDEYPEICARLRAERKSKNIDLSNLRELVNNGLMAWDLCDDVELFYDGLPQEVFEELFTGITITSAQRAWGIAKYARAIGDKELENAIWDNFENEIAKECGLDE